MFDPSPSRRVLYCGPSRPAFERLIGQMAPPGPDPTADGLRVHHPRATVEWVPAHGVDEALAVLGRSYVNLIAIDMRGEADEAGWDQRRRDVRRLLAALDDVGDLEARYGFHRILVLLPDQRPERIDPLLVELGGSGVRNVLREPAGDEGFGHRVLDRGVSLILDRRRTRTALCAAGGGTTAIFFELAALKCLEDCVRPGIVHRFDMYFGISAGAVVTSVLANGYAPEELMAAVAGIEGGRIAPLDLSLLRLGHVNVKGLRRTARGVADRVGRSLFELVRYGRPPSLNGLFLDATAMASAPFHSDRFEGMLRQILTHPGATNDFARLDRPLYVGASDQDARRHALFGDPGERTPISLAVQGSLSINPAFTSVRIGGQWYEDGAVTRTSNFAEAIQRGANLIFVLDPFVPYVSKEPGFAAQRGMLYNIDQDVRSLSFTRYENTRDWVLRRYPDISSYTILPSNRLRRLLSANPMDHRPFLEVFRGSYLSTLSRLRQIAHRLDGDLRNGGMELHLEKAEAIADQLQAAAQLTFADFFPDRRVEIPRPPLALERSRSGAAAAP